MSKKEKLEFKKDKKIKLVEENNQEVIDILTKDGWVSKDIKKGK